MSKTKQKAMEVAMAEESHIVPHVKTLEDTFKQAEWLMEQKLVPNSIKTPAHVVGIIRIGASLNMDPITALNAIDIIQGQFAVKAKAIAGLLTKGNVSIEVIKDFEPVYDEKPSVVMVTDAQGNKVPKVDEDGKMTYYRDPDGNVIMKKKEIDRITTLRFTRQYPHGPKTSDISLKWSDCVRAGWTTKDNWLKLPSFMLMARTIARGARIFASDLISGLYTDYEVAEFMNADMEVIGDEVIINQN